jgi:molybdate-binding protein
MANLIRVKQLDQPDLSGFFNTAFIQTGILNATFVDKFTDQNISGVKTFIDGVNLNNIDNLNLSGVDISIRDTNVSITNSNLGTNSANLTVQGSGDFFKGIKIGDFQAGGPIPAISIYDGPNDDYNKIIWSDSNLSFTNNPSVNNQVLIYDFSNDPYSTAQSIAVDSKVVHNTSNETISGIKTFASRPTVNGTGVALNGETTNLPNVVVFTTGNQTISGIKTFGDSGIFSLSGASAVLLSNNPLSIVGSGNTYIQVNIQNRATGTTATADLVITANNGNDSSNYIDLGINNSGYNDPAFSNGGAYDGYLFVNGGSLDIGTQTTGTNIEFHIGGTTAIRTVARITSDGLNIVSGTLSASNVLYNTGVQNISGSKTFFDSGVFSISGALPISLPNNPLSIVGSGTGYIQVNIQNRSTGFTATSDLVITANNGTDSLNYLDLGINNSGYNDPNFSNGGAYDGYLFVNGGNLDIATTPVNSAIEFHAEGTTADKVIARINRSGLSIITGNIYISGNPVLTGNINLYATTTDLASTGSTLVNRINSLSGTLASTGNTLVNSINSLSGSSVLVYGNQNISGSKTFFDSGIFSLTGILPLPLPSNPLAIVGSGNTYVQLNIQNRATGDKASADLVITANNGTDSANFINLGINNVGYSDATFNNTTGLDGYLIMDGGDLDIGTRTPGKIIEFHAGGTTETNVIARISQTGLNIVSGNLTVGGTGVLLSGQNSFILPFSNTSDTANSNTTYYFSNLDYGLRANTGQAKVLALENFVARKASWTIVASVFTPATISTGYFINYTKNTTGIISEVISASAASTAYNYGGLLNPPITVNINDEIGVGFRTGPSLNSQGHSGCRNLVNVYCYN